MQAIVDCNSFYCSCERLFQPQLRQAPIVVLSNNDGCIVSRSDEAKQLGIAMAVPYFQAKELIEKNKVHAFSSNYHLYGDLSWRVMETMRQLMPPGCVEVYSVDEAFLDLAHIQPDALEAFCIKVKNTIENWTGISVSIGVGPNKVLSKVANRLAKKNKIKTGCIVILNTTQKIQKALQETPVEDIWGIGFSYSEKLKIYGVHTAFALSIKDLSWGKRFLGGITGIKLIRDNVFTSYANMAAATPSGSAVNSVIQNATYTDTQSVDVTIWLKGYFSPQIDSSYEFVLNTF